jgi:hypothetical protein
MGLSYTKNLKYILVHLCTVSLEPVVRFLEQCSKFSCNLCAKKESKFQSTKTLSVLKWTVILEILLSPLISALLVLSYISVYSFLRWVHTCNITAYCNTMSGSVGRTRDHVTYQNLVTGMFSALSVFGRRIKAMIRLRPEQVWTCNVTRHHRPLHSPSLHSWCLWLP